MNKVFLILPFLVSALAFSVESETAKYIFETPDISSNNISFSYDGNIWLVPRSGGQARQLTNAKNPVTNGRFSVDGRQIAYTKTSESNADVYVIPTSGGVSTRVTYHPEEDSVVDWLPTNNTLLIKSMRESFRPRFNEFYHVSAEGGFPEKLPLAYAETGSYCSDGRLAYTYTNDFQDGNETWKRYKGGRAPDVWLYDPQNETATQITSYDGIDTSPMCVGANIYFLSDRGVAQRSNIWRYGSTGQLTQITFFADYDVRHPGASSDAIVFENGGHLYVYDVTTEKYEKLNITIEGQQRHLEAAALSLEDNISSIKLSDDGSKILMTARGEVLRYDIETEVLSNVTNTPLVAERFPAESADGVLAYMSDASGEYQLHSRSHNKKEVQQSNYGEGFRFSPYWSPNGRYLAYVDEKQNILLADHKKSTSKVIGQSQWKTYYALDEFSFSWSPDSQWLLFVMADESRNQATFLYELARGRLTKITSGFYNDQQAVFCNSGTAICLLSQRDFSAVHGDIDSTWAYTNSAGLYMMPLRLGVQAGFSSSNDKARRSKPAAPSWSGIDIDNLENRMVRIPVPAGRMSALYSAGNTLIYQRNQSREKSSIYSFNIETAEEQQLKVDALLKDVAANGVILTSSRASKSFTLLANDPQRSASKLSLSGYIVKVDFRLEKQQVLRDAWRFYRDFYYDPQYHGRDWQHEWERYESLLNAAHSQRDLNRLVREMGGELEGGHVWATATAARVRWKNESVGLLGIDLQLHKGLYRIEKIYDPAPWLQEHRSPLAAPGMPALSGKYLLSINGVELSAARSPWQALQGLLNKSVELLVSDTPAKKRSQTVIVKTIESERQMREMEWVEKNRRYVALKTDGKIGYIYVPDTSRLGQDALMKQYQAQFHKQGLVIDARFNSGGALGDRLVELLNRPVLNYFSTRHAKDSQLPEIANSGPKLLITNGWSYSGGDGFPYLFQQAKVGPVLGERTWGGLIGPSQPIPLINGGAVSPSPQRVYDTQGSWGTGGSTGVTPDIVVKNTQEDLMKGIDLQLDKSIEWVMRQLPDYKKLAKPPIPRS